MKTKALKKKITTSSKKTTKRTKESLLAICPTSGAGWCPYPFSMEQLAKRIKRLEEKQLVSVSK